MTELARFINTHRCKMVLVGTNKVFYSCFKGSLHKIGFFDTKTNEASPLIDPGLESAGPDTSVGILGSEAAFVLTSQPRGQSVRVIGTTPAYPYFLSDPFTFRKGVGGHSAIGCGVNNKMFIACKIGPNLFYDVLKWTGSQVAVQTSGTLKRDPDDEQESIVTSLVATDGSPASAVMAWSSNNENERFRLSSFRFDDVTEERIDVQFSDSIPACDPPGRNHVMLFPDMTAIVAYRVREKNTIEIAKAWDLSRGASLGTITTFNFPVEWMHFVRVDSDRALMFYHHVDSKDLMYRRIKVTDRVKFGEETLYRKNCILQDVIYLKDRELLLAVNEFNKPDLTFEKLIVA